MSQSHDSAEPVPPSRGSGEAAYVTQVLDAIQRGDRHATDELLSLVYYELRRLACSRLAGEPNAGAGFTLQATALVHEAYLRLLSGPAAPEAVQPQPDGSKSVTGPARWQNRGHFFGAAALAMRRILVERARHQKRLKHGGGQQRVDLDGEQIASAKADYDQTDLVALDDAIHKLEQIDPRKAKIVSLRYFAGLSVQETANALDLSPATVKNEWAFARAWLHRELGGKNPPDTTHSDNAREST
jgi:RNA polymerase sigma factor (sigma-70 family)